MTVIVNIGAAALESAHRHDLRWLDFGVATSPSRVGLRIFRPRRPRALRVLSLSWGPVEDILERAVDFHWEQTRRTPFKFLSPWWQSETPIVCRYVRPIRVERQDGVMVSMSAELEELAASDLDRAVGEPL